LDDRHVILLTIDGENAASDERAEQLR